MKKGLLLVLLSLCFLTGCSKKMVCTAELSQDGVDITSKYEATYDKDDKVIKIHTVETIKSDDKDDLESFEKLLKESYSMFDDIKHYDYSIKLSGNKLVSTVDADYSKIDMDKFLEIDDSLETVFKDGHIDIDDLEDMYEAIGAECKK